jgi:hypothetical protein
MDCNICLYQGKRKLFYNLVVVVPIFTPYPVCECGLTI